MRPLIADFYEYPDLCRPRSHAPAGRPQPRHSTPPWLPIALQGPVPSLILSGSRIESLQVARDAASLPRPAGRGMIVWTDYAPPYPASVDAT